VDDFGPNDLSDLLNVTSEHRAGRSRPVPGRARRYRISIHERLRAAHDGLLQTLLCIEECQIADGTE